ncbi:acetyl-CoA carboxylase family protein [Pseudohoeflea coraliihabitans]|uniref:Carbamoyl-phosphate synthase large subunit n=1 Tax=Pseudohoeflea coraliihabitans TaxID=2860393 RepID=A0ABS6WSP5_9HYPH|nr:carboxyl transferase domain-containing protein [Pseudohoeflea sp. DP4N28-3]MBW3098966.1 carbamoyl-phosphate synthase large subunit [Pseudohoeflea sp. DP4N28-3]
MQFNSLLIANRGEIAIRIARAAANLGLTSVGIAPKDDASCLHLGHVDRARDLEGSGPAAYLDIEQIIGIARDEGCDAIHPGYGFLSESAEFARACEAAGIVFVGPRPETLATFGDKVSARKTAERLGVPLPEGSQAGISLDEAHSFMEGLGEGAAAMIKAVAGGGGRGMRVVRSLDALAGAYAVCRSEARTSFGRDEVYIERYVPRARHVEVQVLGDGDGTVIHFGDRECSLQRRHQKLIEIAPCPGLSASLRQRVIDAALTLARDVQYRSLGTFEFLVDTAAGTDGAFYFMEANPRLQVEHTVTEEVAGIDLVETQLRLVGGASLADLGLDADNPPALRGFAIQARINMERMMADGSTVPGSGTLTTFDIPSGPGIRVDSLGYTGYRVSPSYDSLLAKIIAVSRQPDFSGALSKLRRSLDETRIEGVDTNLDFLRALLGHPALEAIDFHTQFVEEALPDLLAVQPPRPRFFDRAGAPASSAPAGGLPAAAAPEGQLAIVAPMPGALSQIRVAPGTAVVAGQELALVEAMKMQMAVVAPADGVISAVHVSDGDIADADTPLFFLAPQEGSGIEARKVETVDLDEIRPELAELFERRAGLLDENRPDAVAKREKIGKRMVRENLAEFFDETRYDEFGSLTFAAQRSRRSIDELIRVSPADGLITAIGTVNSDLFDAERSRCMAMAYDYTVFAGTQGFNGHHKQDRMLRIASDWSLPIMLWAEGGGGRPGDTDFQTQTGLASTTFAHLAALNGKAPLIGVVTGRCFAGNAAMAGCCDVIIATEDASLGMAGPAMIEGGGLGLVKPDEVGPISVQAPNGVVDLVVADERQAVAEARRYLGFFQGDLAGWEAADQRHLRHAVPQNRMRAYDIRALLDLFADSGSVMELRRAFAPGMITALIRLKGRAVGVIANDSRVLGGAIDADCADKAARFMQLCDGFGIPLLSLCDTPGFMVGPEAEKTALVRHVSRMFITAASLSVPMVTLVLRKAYGLGAMAMAGGSFHAPVASLAWPTGEFGGMGLEGAVRLAYRSDLAAAAEGAERDALFNRLLDTLYERGKALNVAAALDIDDVIDPQDSRSRIAAAFAAAGTIARGGRGRRIDTW